MFILFLTDVYSMILRQSAKHLKMACMSTQVSPDQYTWFIHVIWKIVALFWLGLKQDFVWQNATRFLL